ncbi:MAG: hypothetical protein BRD48_03985 [Bacteroidetes bacterium QS_9_68_14]|nr:MAG: hypothetical protein BRD48_03985 [Bacteroidetes bacterium QS_9_68_14]
MKTPRLAPFSSGGLASCLSGAGLLALAGLVLLAAAGCRAGTYGKYNSTEKMLPEMRQSVQLFANDLQRARAARDLLRQAAERDSTLRLVAEEYTQAVEEHQRVLENNRDALARIEEDLPGYRRMHRVLGSFLSEHQTTRNRYRSLRKAVRYPGITARLSGSARGRTVPGTPLRARDETYTEGRYYVAPIFYERLQSSGNDLTMRQALAERQQRRQQGGRRALPEQKGTSRLPGTTDAPPADTAGRVSR